MSSPVRPTFDHLGREALQHLGIQLTKRQIGLAGARCRQRRSLLRPQQIGEPHLAQIRRLIIWPRSQVAIRIAIGRAVEERRMQLGTWHSGLIGRHAAP